MFAEKIAYRNTIIIWLYLQSWQI